jgi:hypothetical protein
VAKKLGPEKLTFKQIDFHYEKTDFLNFFQKCCCFVESVVRCKILAENQALTNNRKLLSIR